MVTDVFFRLFFPQFSLTTFPVNSRQRLLPFAVVFKSPPTFPVVIPQTSLRAELGWQRKKLKPVCVCWLQSAADGIKAIKLKYNITQ